MVFAGDHLQLPPTVLSDKATKSGLARTLFERLHAMYGESISQMLTVQYRMHQDIMAWSSAALYDNRLTAHDSVAAHTVATLPGLSTAESSTSGASSEEFAAALVLVDTAGCDMEEQKEEEGGSSFNDGEARCVLALTRALRACGVGAAHIGVITPYAAQKSRHALSLSLSHCLCYLITCQTFDHNQASLVTHCCPCCQRRIESTLSSLSSPPNLTFMQDQGAVCRSRHP